MHHRHRLVEQHLQPCQGGIGPGACPLVQGLPSSWSLCLNLFLSLSFIFPKKMSFYTKIMISPRTSWLACPSQEKLIKNKTRLCHR